MCATHVLAANQLCPCISSRHCASSFEVLKASSLPRRRGEELLRKRCGLDSPKPSVNLDNPALMAKLFQLFQGSPEHATANTSQQTAVVPDDHVLPAGVLLQSRLMNLFTKSTAAANSFPGTVQVSMLTCPYNA